MSTPTKDAWVWRHGDIQRKAVQRLVRGDQVPVQHQLLPQVGLTSLERINRGNWRGVWSVRCRNHSVNHAEQHNIRESDHIQGFLHFGRRCRLQRTEGGSHDWSRLWLQESQYVLQQLWDAVPRGKLYKVPIRSQPPLILQVTETNVMTWPHRTCSEKLSKEGELAKCLSKESIENFEKHSPMSLIPAGDDLKILSKSNLNETWEKKEWKRISTKCHEMTDHIKECNDVRVVTTVDERLAGQDSNLTLVELVPSNESFQYIHEPKMDIESFLLTMGAILSTGFGFSLYTWRGCRWKRHKKDGKCCFFGFKSDIEDSEARRVTQIENGRRADRKLIGRLTENNAKLNVDVHKD